MTTAGDPDGLAVENRELRKRIAELERAAAENADAAALLQSVLTAMPGFVTHADGQLRIRYINRYQPGLAPAQVIGRPVWDFIDPAFHESAKQVVERTRSTGDAGWFEVQGVGAHGQVAVYDTYVAAVAEPDGSTGICMVALEVTEHKRRERALHESQEKLRVALDATSLGLWVWDVTADKIVWDEGMCRVHGSETPTSVQEYMERCVLPEDREVVMSHVQGTVATGKFQSSSYRIVRGDGAVRWVLATGAVIHDKAGNIVRLVGATLDVTEQRALEEQVRHAQKMQAIGSLTAGIAHNFNNMLTVILPTLEIGAQIVPKERESLMRDALHAAKRASELVHQLMTFAGQPHTREREPRDITAIVDAAVAICQRAFDQRVSLRTEVDGSATVYCNAGQLEQVLVNLLLNARDAVLERSDGRGHVTVRIRTRAGVLPALGTELDPRPCVAIQVQDDGIGMTDEVKARAFEPFFTTKGVGRGTGLGLTTSYAIIRDHYGTLECESAPAAGTTFTIRLPLSTESASEPQVVNQTGLPHGLRALIVDDEVSVRTAISQLLSDAGVHVRGAGSGREALSLLAEHSDIDVVLLDRSMPDAPGERFVPRMRELAPRARILFFSGQTIEPELAAIVDGVVTKPVQGKDLMAAMCRALAKG